MGTPRTGDTATRLPDGKVLVAGGENMDGNTGSVLSSAELYDPTTRSWTDTRFMDMYHWSHTATLLSDGRVLVAGGFTGNAGSGGSAFQASAELYDPGSGSWTTTGDMVTHIAGHTTTLLADGKVLVAGGTNANTDSGDSLAFAELYDPTTGSWTTTGTMVTPRTGHTATLLPDGMVLVAGGDNVDGTQASAELYDPGTGSWTATASMRTPRTRDTATLLGDGKVLVAGGSDGSGAMLTSAELYDPGSWR
jgi:N-acetylneuraminic acid mutarotase